MTWNFWSIHFTCSYQYVILISWWILVSIYALTLLTTLTMFGNSHFLWILSMCIYLENACIYVNNVLVMSCSRWTGLFLKYAECLVGVGAIYVVLLFLLFLVPSWMWWVTFTSLWINYLQLSGIFYCCGRSCIYFMWTPPEIQMHINTGHQLVNVVIGWALCILVCNIQGDNVRLTCMCVWIWLCWHLAKRRVFELVRVWHSCNFLF